MGQRLPRLLCPAAPRWVLALGLVTCWTSAACIDLDALSATYMRPDSGDSSDAGVADLAPPLPRCAVEKRAIHNVFDSVNLATPIAVAGAGGGEFSVAWTDRGRRLHVGVVKSDLSLPSGTGQLHCTTASPNSTDPTQDCYAPQIARVESNGFTFSAVSVNSAGVPFVYEVDRKLQAWKRIEDPCGTNVQPHAGIVQQGGTTVFAATCQQGYNVVWPLKTRSAVQDEVSALRIARAPGANEFYAIARYTADDSLASSMGRFDTPQALTPRVLLTRTRFEALALDVAPGLNPVRVAGARADGALVFIDGAEHVFSLAQRVSSEARVGIAGSAKETLVVYETADQPGRVILVEMRENQPIPASQALPSLGKHPQIAYEPPFPGFPLGAYLVVSTSESEYMETTLVTCAP